MTRTILSHLPNYGLTLLGAVLSGIAAMAPQGALALDYGFKFNQHETWTLGTTQPDGTVSYEWVDALNLSRRRPVGDYEVEGTIFGLDADGSGQAPKSIVITKDSQDPLSVGSYTFSQGSGFTVNQGEIEKSIWIGTLNSKDTIRRLVFSTTPASPFWPLRRWARLDSGALGSNYYDEYGNLVENSCGSIGGGYAYCQTQIGLPEGSTPIFSPLAPASSVPGPLPILGAAAAYRSSRQLKRRLQQRQPGA